MEPAYSIRHIPVWGDVILSPMDGYSDLPFRLLCRQLGSALSLTEFIGALDVLGGKKLPPRVQAKVKFAPEERPVGFQIFDSDPARLLRTALYLLPLEPDFIDVNMGCSSPCVSGRGAGAGLLREPEKIATIFATLTRELPIPVTGKIRLGWDADSLNYLEVAQAIEANGGAVLAVHGRTRQQGYGGQADWDAIAAVKAAVRIPVIGNGDVRTAADIDRLRAHTGCDAVMIGRAAMGNPWIFARRERDQVAAEEVQTVMGQHLGRMLDFYGPERGLILFRKHAYAYLRPLGMTRKLRARLFNLTEVTEFQALVAELLASGAPA
jgi:nifR3 family TIM-barrel protein